ncbi:amidase [Shimia marina]|uniref:Glutamyl-tRNA(Gln) amidotransferase subunit A n=1 Tax=Shimia marina TaxID=321267 RepID=A0A0P1FCW6_9RHOB|nr:amidase [Shimia marina]CUH53001.1 Glutamyl-tRNA(Gln) amidotransferase subunit A [Shimia marina]SFD92111.1 amidase [Shimia marina]
MSAFLDWDAAVLVAALREGRLTAEAVMAATLDRITARNEAVNAIVDVRDPSALIAEARAADAVPYDARGALHGLPMAIKALAHVKGTRNTEGSPLYADRISEGDSVFVAQLRAAGAIFIGKTNVPEFGLGSHSYNPVHGVTVNPYDSRRTAGGSSGGAGAALALGMVALADGSDMMGSLRNPAGWNNVYGFRPSWGVVPREPGAESFWQQLSTIGPMARSPRDCALLLSVMAQDHPAVPFNMPEQDWDIGDQGDMSGARIGWLKDWGGAMPMEAGIVTLCEAGLAEMAALGAEVSELPAPFDAEEMFESWSVLRAFALAGELAPLYLDTRKRDRLKPAAQWEIQRGLDLSALALHRATKTRSAWFARAAALFEEYDVLALPVAQVFPFHADWDWPREIAGVAMDSYHRWMQVMVPASLLGLPAISLPVGFDPRGLPMGIQLIGAKGQDRRVLEIAQAYHVATQWPQRRPPVASDG